MRLMQVLETITSKLNEVANNITGSSNGNINETAGGLDGLGTINTHANGEAIESSIVHSVNSNNVADTSNLHLYTSINHLQSCDEYREYIREWLLNTGVFEDVSNQFMEINYNNIAKSLYIKVINSIDNTQNNQIFCIIACHKYTEITTLLENIKEQSANIQVTKTVIIGPYSYSMNDRNNLVNTNTELLGLEQIMSINDVIDMAIKKFPYKTLLETGFIALLLSNVYHKYNGDSMMDSIKYNLNNITNSLQNKADEISNIKVPAETEPTLANNNVDATSKLSLDKSEIGKLTLDKN